MYRIPLQFHRRLQRGEVPITYIVIETHLGYRAYSAKEMSRTFDISGYYADGTYVADGTTLAGSLTIGLIDRGARILSFGSIERTIQPRKSEILSAYSGKQMQNVSIELDNADRYFSRLIAREPFLGRPMSIRCGYEADGYLSHISLFAGVITDISLQATMILEADER